MSTGSIEDPYNEMFQRLINYKEKYGDCLVPKRFKEDPKLANWVSTKRTAYNKNNLSKEKIEALEALGFSWDPYEDLYNQMFQRIVKYKEKYGDCLVYKGFEDKRLAAWVNTQRQDYKKKDLSKEKIEALEAIGFIWDAHKYYYNEMFQRLIKYKEKHGDCLVPHKFKEDPKLATWVGTQRHAYNKNNLSKEKIEALEAIGFSWDPIEDYYNKMFQRLEKYKEKYGDCLVPTGFKEDQQLANWVFNQRRAYNKNNLSKEKIEALEEIGFVWSLR